MSALRPLARRVHPEPSRRRRPHRARPRSRARRLPRLRALALLAALASLLPSPSNAQVAARRAPRGELSGLELQIEGSLEVAQGGTLRLSLAAFEIRGTHDLRPSPHARLRATTPLDPAATPLELEADDLGRALLELPIPGDAPSRFTLLIEASQAGARRRFELPITVHSALRIELFSASRRVIPGERAHFFGRLVQRASGAGLAGATIELEADDAEGPIGAPTRLRTDASGLFEHTLELPLELSGRLRIRAALLASSAPEGHHAGPESIALEIWRPSAPPLLVRLAPERWSVPSGGTIGVELSVRRPDGRPVEGALISRTGPRPDPQAAPIRTDARGRARIEWTAPRVSGIADGTIQLLVREERGPRLMASAAVRLYEAEHAAELSVEGGALVEGLRQIVLARVVRVDGRPVPLGTRLRLEGPRLDRPIEGQTGADGVVRFEIRSGAAREGDRCGGVVSTALELYLGRDTEPLAPRCVPVDPDATLALSPLRALAHAGGTLRVRIERRSDVARAPLMLSLFDSAQRLIGAQSVAPEAREASISLPNDARGLVQLRARPILDAGQEVRGGIASAWIEPGTLAPLVASLEPSGLARVRLEGSAEPPPSLLLFALPAAEVPRLEREIRGASIRGAIDLSRATDDSVRAWTALRTARDQGASAVLRGGRLEPVPAPATPAEAGLLRDPWRARQRFVRGRLGLLFRAVEARVAASVPGRLEDVAVRGPRGLRLNARILEGVEFAGAEGANGLGGEPLRIEALERLDPAFTYDAVARRITRQRLFRLLFALREFVRERGLDLPWARPGNPSDWMPLLVHGAVPGQASIAPRELVDAWGRPFALRPIRTRPRYPFLSPVDGFELSSAGPDGRFGTRDDLVDPSARVLPEGLYAEAVGESRLIARLGGAELGRASVERLASLFLGSNPSLPLRSEAAAGWGIEQPALPRLFEAPPFPLAIERPDRFSAGAMERLALPADGLERPLALGDEPRTWGLLALAFSDRGALSIARTSVRAGARLIMDPVLPPRLRIGEPLVGELGITNLEDAPIELRLRAEAEGIEFRLPASITLGAGEATRVPIEVRARRIGRHSLTLRVETAQGERLASSDHELSADRGLHPLRRRAMGLVGPSGLRLRLGLPSDARGAGARLVLIAPSRLADDPDLRDRRRQSPALIGWAYRLSSRPIPADLRASMLRSRGASEAASGRLEAACALAAMSSLEEDPAGIARSSRLIERVSRAAAFPDRDPEAGRIRSLAATTAALAPTGFVVALDDAPAPGSMGGARPEFRAFVGELHRVLSEVPEEPTLLARAAAALLLIDPRDGHGLAMLERASAGLDAGSPALILGPSEDRGALHERSVASLALAVAAHQAGRSELAHRLLRGALPQAPAIMAGGVEGSFWLLAAASFGAMGPDAESIVYELDGRRIRAELASGYALVPIDVGAGQQLEIRLADDRATIARLEAAYARPFEARQGGPLSLELEGDAGALHEVSGLELAVQVRSRVRSPIVDIQIPASAEIDALALSSIGAAPGILGVERREPGLLRLRLETMARGSRRVIALPFRWLARGPVLGLGAVAYPASLPHRMTVLPSRVLEPRAP